MSWNHAGEERVREAIESGELEFPEELRGQTLDLRDYFATPEHLRMGYSVLKSSGFVPLEVDLLKQIRALEKSFKEEPDPLRRQDINLQLAELRVRVDAKPGLSLNVPAEDE